MYQSIKKVKKEYVHVNKKKVKKEYVHVNKKKVKKEYVHVNKKKVKKEYVHVNKKKVKKEKLRGGYWIQNVINCIGGVMVSVLVSSAVEREFEPRLGQTKNYKIGICCFSAKHTALRRKSKGWLAWNQNNVSEWSDISTCGLLFQ
jgi:hypothetical protein